MSNVPWPSGPSAFTQFTTRPMDISEEKEHSDGGDDHKEALEEGELELTTVRLALPRLRVRPPQERLRAVWGSGNQLLLASVSAQPSRGGAAPDIVDFNWDVFASHNRSLLYSWRNMFIHVQQRMAATSGPEERSIELKRASQHYRAELSALVSNCSEALRNNDSRHLEKVMKEHHFNDAAVFAQYYRETANLLEYASSLWHFFEIFCIDANENITSQMRHWFCESVPAPLFPDDEWRTIHRLTCQGRVKEAYEAITRLEQHHFTNSELLELLRELLAEGLPSIGGRGWAPDEFVRNFNTWRRHCQQLMEDPVVRNDPNVYKLFQVFAGDVDVLNELCESWEELLVARLLHSEPYTGKQDMLALADQCMLAQKNKRNSVDDDDDRGPLEDCLVKIMDFDVIGAITAMHQTIGLSWITAHLSDLLRHAGYLEVIDAPDLSPQEVDLREYYIRDFASSLGYHAVFWELSIDYFLSTGPQGLQYVGDVLLHAPINSDRVAVKVLDVCDRLGFPAHARGIQTRLGNIAWKQQRYGAAVHWYAQARQLERISRMCNSLIDATVINSTATAHADIEAVLSATNDLQKVPELNLLRQWQTLRELQERLKSFSGALLDEESAAQHRMLLGKAFGIIITLLEEGGAPKRLWTHLLYDAAAILEASTATQPIASVTQVQRLMVALEETVVSHMRSHYSIPGQEQEETIAVIRLALARAYGSATLAEQQ